MRPKTINNKEDEEYATFQASLEEMKIMQTLHSDALADIQAIAKNSWWNESMGVSFRKKA